MEHDGVLSIRINKKLYEKFKKHCKAAGWDIAKRIRHIMAKDIRNLKREIRELAKELEEA